ncbi:MAG: peptide chain release factor-like protein [Candidatus Omnitrophica bacterium]|nr:peptide chain release factor-like protein [Candidatus Omnitrophota bacterium]MDD5430482.1 peptide chain release factor-like protein [Candidatus Omnitrophota bacterium]
MKFSKYGVTMAKEQELAALMKKLQINEKDIKEKFIRSNGPGGQNVNKTSTCVYLKHLPSGIQVKCQNQRSQALNRFFARRLLAQKIESLLLKTKSKKQQEIEKIRRQKRKRSKRAKEKILRLKRRQGEKKKFRSKTLIDE